MSLAVSTQLATSLTFSIERWPEFWRDCQHILPIHWKEMALNQDTIALDVDADRFKVIDDQGLLHILTARADGWMVGYYIAIVMPHLHYKNSGNMAFTDMYYLLKPFRNGNGVKLFAEAERTLRERGVTKAYISCKVHSDHTELFEKLGWTMSDKSFVKVL
jgi:hypothetical protein